MIYNHAPFSASGGRHNDDDCNEYSSSRPSTGTLWDFLETKLPANGMINEVTLLWFTTISQVFYFAVHS